MFACEIVKKFGLVEDTTDPRWTGTDKRVWRGHGMHDWYYYDNVLPVSRGSKKFACEWTFMEKWCNGYRAVWSSYSERATFTYCEGDLTLVQCGTVETFAREMKEGEEFYEKGGY